MARIQSEAKGSFAVLRIEKLEKEKVWDKPIVTELTELNNFYRAEQYHHDYFNQHPENQYCQFVVKPKVEKFRKIFKEKLKNNSLLSHPVSNFITRQIYFSTFYFFFTFS